MKCEICGKENEVTNIFCVGCGSSLNHGLNEKIFKKINILRIISTLSYLALLVYFIYVYISEIVFDVSSPTATAFILGPIILTIINYLAILSFLNLVYFNKNIISNIKVVSVIEIITFVLLLIEQIPMLNIQQKIYTTNFLLILGTLILLFVSIFKLLLLKKVSKIDVEDKVKINNRKCIKKFIVLCIGVTGIIHLIVLFSSPSNCNKHYDLDEKQINQELKSYTYIGEEIVKESPIGFECRNEDKETYISFKDKYNNDVRLTISDHNKGKVNRYSAIKVIANIQFVNNILKNEKIKIIYDEETKNYKFVINDFILGEYFEIRISLSYEEPKDVPLYQFDLNNIPYNVSITLDQKYQTAVDKNYIMPYVESLVHSIYNSVDQQKISKFELWLNDDPDLIISSYNSYDITWLEKEQ